MSSAFPAERERTNRSPFDYVLDDATNGSTAVSTPGKLARARRQAWKGRASTSYQGYRMWQGMHVAFDEVADELLDTLRVRPQVGEQILRMGLLLYRFFAPTVSLAVRPSDEASDPSRQWLVVVRVKMDPEMAFLRLNQFDEFLAASSIVSSFDDVIATVELA